MKNFLILTLANVLGGGLSLGLWLNTPEWSEMDGAGQFVTVSVICAMLAQVLLLDYAYLTRKR